METEYITKPPGALATALARPRECVSGHDAEFFTLYFAWSRSRTGRIGRKGSKQGALGDAQLLERRAGRMAGVRIYPGLLLQHLSTRFLFDETGLKPYPIARQALAAVEACRELVGRNTKRHLGNHGWRAL